MTRLAARLVAYAPNGARLGFLPEHKGWDASMPVNATSALNLTYPRGAQNGNLLDAACEVAVEVNPGTGWTEPPNARYVRLVWDGDLNDTAAIRKYAMPGYAHFLHGIPVLDAADPSDANTDADGKRKFLSATAGTILTTVLQEARALDPEVVDGLTLDFTTTLDSAGQPWANVITIYYETGTSLYTILDNLAAQGIVDWHMQGRALRAYNADTALAEHTGKRIMDGRAGQTTEAPAKGTIEALRHLVVLRGDEGLKWVRDNPGAPQPWGKTITVINQGGVRDETTADTLIGAELAAGRRERVQYTRGVTFEQAKQPLPFVDYAPGDYVEAKSAAGVFTEYRVQQITLRQGADLAGTLTLNDRFEDALVRQAKRTKGIVGGATTDSGAGTPPTPPSQSQRAPRAPLGLVVETSATWNADGAAYAYAEAAWDAVTTGLDGLAIDIESYELWAKDAAVLQPSLTNTALNPNAASSTGFLSNNGSIWAVARNVPVPAPHPQGITTAARSNRISTASSPNALSMYNADGLNLSATQPRRFGAWFYIEQPGYHARIRRLSGSAEPWTALPAGEWIFIASQVDEIPAGTHHVVEVATVGGAQSGATDYAYITGVTALEGGVTPTESIWGGRPEDATAVYSWAGAENNSPSIAESRVAQFQLLARTDELEAIGQPFELGSSWVFKVRATSTTGKVGDFSAEVLATMPATLEALIAPTSPSLESRLGTVIVRWDGQLGAAADEPFDPPPHFAYAFVEWSETEAGDYLATGQQLRRRGQILIQGRVLGSEIWVRMRAVDRLGNISDPSVATPVTVIGFDPGSITEEDIADGAIVASKLAAESVTALALQAGIVETYHLAAAVGAELDISSNNAVNILVGDVANVNARVDENGQIIDELSTYYRFGAEGATISSPGSPYELTLTSDGIQISEAGVPVSEWNAGQLLVRSFVGDEVVLGNHKIEKYTIGTVVRAL